MVDFREILESIASAGDAGYYSSPEHGRSTAFRQAIYAGGNPSLEAQSYAESRARNDALKASQREESRRGDLESLLPGIMQGLKGKSPQDVFDVLSPVLGVDQAYQYASNFAKTQRDSAPDIDYTTDPQGNVIAIDKAQGSARYVPLGDTSNAPMESVEPLPYDDQTLPEGLSPAGRASFEDQLIKQRFDESKKKKEFMARKPQARRSAQTAADKMLDSIDLIDREIGNVDWTTAGTVGAALSSLPITTDASDLKSQIDTLLARSGFDEIVEMKKSGGTLGAVSNNELNLLQAAKVNLQNSQSADQLRQNMLLLKDQLKKSRKAIFDAYKEDYGEEISSGNDVPQSLLDKGITPEVYREYKKKKGL